MLADRQSLAAIHRIKGVKEETVCEWLQRVAAQVEEEEQKQIRRRQVFPHQLVLHRQGRGESVGMFLID